eukprot:741597-Amphidinium_carterae.1
MSSFQGLPMSISSNSTSRTHSTIQHGTARSLHFQLSENDAPVFKPLRALHDSVTQHSDEHRPNENDKPPQTKTPLK